MIEWLDVNVAYWHWIVFGVALAVLEMLVPSFFMLWLGVSAVVVGLSLLFAPFSFTVQLLTWGVLSLACLVGWFKFIAPKMHDKTRSGMAMEALKGKVGTVLEYQNSSSRGQLRFPAPLLGEDEWRFICETPLQPGDKVTVVDTSGNDLIVKPV
ncbi:MAG: NfeD family protein [Cellvibrionaceae bacterium]